MFQQVLVLAGRVRPVHGAVVLGWLLAIALAACNLQRGSGQAVPVTPVTLPTAASPGAGEARGYPPPRPWHGYLELASARNESGLFSVKAASLSAQEWLFFYALQTAEGSPGPITATAQLARAGEHLGEALTVEQVQPLGTLGDFSIGVIHVAAGDRPVEHQDPGNAKFVILQVTPAGATGPAWQVAPVQQLYPEAYDEFFRFDDAPPAAVVVAGEANMMYGLNPTGIFRLVLKDVRFPATQQLSLKVDMQAGAVSLIGEAEYNALQSQLSITPIPDGGEVPRPAGTSLPALTAGPVATEVVSPLSTPRGLSPQSPLPTWTPQLSGLPPTPGVVLEAHSGHVKQGQPYAFDLSTHCGIDFDVDFDTSFWDAVDRAYLPAAIGNPVQHGTMTLLDVDHARFGFEEGYIIFTRHTGAKVVPGFCA